MPNPRRDPRRFDTPPTEGDPNFQYPPLHEQQFAPRVPGLLELLPEGSDLGTMGGVGAQFSVPLAGGRLGAQYLRPPIDDPNSRRDPSRQYMLKLQREF